MIPDRTTDEALRTAAAEWVATLHAAVPSSPAEARDYETNCRLFIEWVSQAPEHVAAFLRADDTFCRLGGLDSQFRVDIDALRDRYACEAQRPLDLRGIDRAKSASRTPRAARLAIAASIVLCLAIAAFIQVMNRAPNYVTAVGEQLAVKLPDGSLMLLNTRSRARIDFSANERLVHLSTGEALFEVEHDPKRPFIVLTPSATVRAVGTNFDVYSRPDNTIGQADTTTVSVLEGIVQIAPKGASPNPVSQLTTPAEAEPADRRRSPLQDPLAQLVAGQQARVASGRVTRTTTPDVADAVAWRDRVLVFQGTPIAEVAEEYNRYNTIQIRIQDPDIEQRQMSGTYSADRPENLVRYLEEAFPVVVTRQGNNWLVRKR